MSPNQQTTNNQTILCITHAKSNNSAQVRRLSNTPCDRASEQFQRCRERSRGLPGELRLGEAQDGHYSWPSPPRWTGRLMTADRKYLSPLMSADNDQRSQNVIEDGDEVRSRTESEDQPKASWLGFVDLTDQRIRFAEERFMLVASRDHPLSGLGHLASGIACKGIRGGKGTAHSGPEAQRTVEERSHKRFRHRAPPHMYAAC